MVHFNRLILFQVLSFANSHIAFLNIELALLKKMFFFLFNKRIHRSHSIWCDIDVLGIYALETLLYNNAFITRIGIHTGIQFV